MARDLYTVLGVSRDASAETITEAVDRLTRQASVLANTAPERSQQLREQIRSVKERLLGSDDERRRYDEELKRIDEEDNARLAALLAAKREVSLLDPAIGPTAVNALRLVKAGLYTRKARTIGRELQEDQAPQ